jgi:hypothetical protein
MNIFYAATTITLGNGRKTPFWHAPWLDGRAPKEIAPNKFDASKYKKWTVAKALHEDSWISNIKIESLVTWERAYCPIRGALGQNQQCAFGNWSGGLHCVETNGEWPILAYKLQFLGLVRSDMYNIVWKAWAPLKAKNHAWIAIQNRLCTVDRLKTRGWLNCGLCPLCKQCTETTDHLFVSCRFTVRIWELIKDWLGIDGIHPRQWAGLTIKEWWTLLVDGATPHRKALASLTLLTVWEIWSERNTKVFRNKQSPSFVILDKIKVEARLWAIAGAKRLGSILLGD